jgi:diaminopimelate decarboxylase
MAKMGGGVDIVSGGELYRALQAGIKPEKIVYSGVGKRVEDLEFALQTGILMFNVESSQEIQKLNGVAKRLNRPANIALRVNPDIDPQTHPYISTGLRENKFGIPIHEALEEYTRAAGLSHLNIQGISCHIGSQLTKISPFVDTLKSLLDLSKGLAQAGLPIKYLDLGGGLGITYDEEKPPHPDEYARAVKSGLQGQDLTLILEPGRVIVGNAGILVVRVLYTKEVEGRRFIITDGAMNDLLRPSLYGSFHALQPVVKQNRKRVTADIVGPICESGDFLARDREIEVVEQGEFLAVMSAGAYGFSMSSNYNSRPRVAEVMVRDDRFEVIRQRETYEDLVRGEQIPSFI